MLRFRAMLRHVAVFTVCLLAVLLSSRMALGQKADPLVGKWNMTSKTPDGDQVAWTLTITYADGKYAATSSAGEGEGQVSDLKVDGANVHFRVPYQGNQYDIDLKLDGDSLVGTWSGGGSSGETKGQKA
jgi:hypothetical protein